MAGGAATPAKSQFTTITLQKFTDKASPLLFLNCALGKSIATAKITFRNIGGPVPYDYFIVEMAPVFISSFNVDCATGDTGVSETIGLSYTTMKITYQPIALSGQLGTPVSATYSVSKNKALPDLP